MSDELKACPNCKGKPKVYLVGGWYKTQCPLCLTTTCESFSEAEAIEHWNTRPLEDALLIRATKAESLGERKTDTIIRLNREYDELKAYKREAEVLAIRADADANRLAKLLIQQQNRVKQAESMVERLIEAGNFVCKASDNLEEMAFITNWHALVAEWEQRRKDD